MIILQLNPQIPVLTPNGDGDAIFLIDYGITVNTVWVVRHSGGKILHYYSDDIRVYGNPMDGKGLDVENFDAVSKIPADAKRNRNF